VRFLRGSPAVPVSLQGTRATVRLRGDFDLAGVPRFEQTLRQLQRHELEHLTLDLADVTFVDLAAVRALVRAHKWGKDSGVRVVVGKPQGHAGRAFSLTGLGREIDLVQPA